MYSLKKESIKTRIADTPVIFKRGEQIYLTGNYNLAEGDFDLQKFEYLVDGNYGDYIVNVGFSNGNIHHTCDCPYPGEGCKHTVAVCLDILDRVERFKLVQQAEETVSVAPSDDDLSYEEIKTAALATRKKSAKSEAFQILLGETFKGEHLITTSKGKQYTVILHNPLTGEGHCSCPDFSTNKLGTCKHILYFHEQVQQEKGFHLRVQKEKFPFVHLYWDSSTGNPRFFYDRQLPKRIRDVFSEHFDKNGFFQSGGIKELFTHLEPLHGIKSLKVDEYLWEKANENELLFELETIKKNNRPSYDVVNARLYPYQKEGVDFSVFKKSAIIADEMGLGKTLQAITTALLKKELFGFEKVLIVCPASLKEQWRREIVRFSNENPVVIGGTKSQRQEMYKNNRAFFKITNYEAVLRDVFAISRFKPHLIILDEAQRIKNYETKTAEAIKSIPHKHSLVITGTPLDNRLEDFYSIAQFASPDMFAPLWEFAASYFILKKNKKNKVLGYKNLDRIHEKIKPLVIRRKKEEVLKELPEQVSNNYYIDLTKEQREIHQGLYSSLLPIVSKKFLTTVDIRRIQQLLLSMRMVCDSTFLIDRKTNISPKLNELEGLLVDLVIENKRKVVLFSEWTTMTYLIGKKLSELGIGFVEFSGKVPVEKRQALINKFNEDPECKVFLSTDAGGVGLNLQVADCVINFDLPWSPAKLNQRIGRVMRIGQKSRCVNVINFVAKLSIEEKILAGIQLKEELFRGVFEGTTDEVEFTREKKDSFINTIRKMMVEEEIATAPEPSDPEEIPESTPHFLNPEALREQEVNFGDEDSKEETGDSGRPGEKCKSENVRDSDGNEAQKINRKAQSPEEVEQVLEKGLGFLSGLMEMATGKSLLPEDGSKSIQFDRENGEVTLKFKLPC